MYTKILIAVDLASNPESVLKQGKEIAEKYAASYQAIYCIEQPIMPMGEFIDPIPIIDIVQLKKEIQPKFESVAEELGISKSFVSVEIGHPVDAITDKAADMGADLIVIGSHGRHGIRLLLGSTANAVLHIMPNVMFWLCEFKSNS